MHGITQAKRRAAVEALGFDPDLVASVSLATDHASVTVIQTVDGVPQVRDGAPVVETLSGPIFSDVEEV